MANRFGTYSINQVKAVVGVYSVSSGRSPDADFVKISTPNERFAYANGPDGEGVRSDTGPGPRDVTIIVMKTSQANAVFSALYAGDISLDGGAGVVPMTITDLGGKDLFFAPNAWIKKMPDDTKSKEAGTVEWEFSTHDSKHFIGGH